MGFLLTKKEHKKSEAGGRVSDFSKALQQKDKKIKKNFAEKLIMSMLFLDFYIVPSVKFWLPEEEILLFHF